MEGITEGDNFETELVTKRREHDEKTDNKVEEPSTKKIKFNESMNIKVSDSNIIDVAYNTNLSHGNLQYLFRKLNIKSNDIENAERKADTRDFKLQSCKVLEDWRQRNGTNATRRAVIEALEECDFLEAKEILMRKWTVSKEMNIKVSDSNIRDVAYNANLLRDNLQYLFKRLGIKTPDIENAERKADTRDFKLQSCKVLEDWRQRNGTNATRSAVIEALEECELVEAKEILTRKWAVSIGMIEDIADELRKHYMANVCKKRIYPWGGKWMDFKEIYIPITIDRDIGPGAKVIKESLETYEELFTFEEDRKQRRFYLMGAPGQGKTSFCAKVAHDWCAGKTLQYISLLFIIDLANVDNDTDVADVICKTMFSNLDIEPAQLRKVIRDLEQSVYFIFDGLDEALRLHHDIKSNSTERKFPVGTDRVIDVMKNLKSRDSRVLVTTRPESEEVMTNIPGYKCLEIKKMARHNVVNYVRKFFGVDHETKELGDRLLELINENKVTLDTSTPLVTLLMCFYWTETEGRHGIPERLLTLYANILAILYKRKPQDFFTKEEIIEHLGQLASSCLTPYKTKIVFTENHIKKACNDPDAGEQLLAQAKGMGILYRKGLGLQFFHKSGQEYCAGVYLANHHQDKLPTYLAKITSVKHALNLGMVLKFASCKTDAGNLIVEKLIAIFKADPKCPQYYEEKEVIVDQDSDSPVKERHPVLEYDDSRTVQLFIELCLECIFEGDLKNQMCAASRSIFPAGQIHFTGLGQKLVSSISYYMRHCGENVHTIHLYPIAHMKDDNMKTIEKGAMSEVFAQRWKANMSRQIHGLQRVCRRFVEANKETISEDISLQFKHFPNVHAYVAKLAAYISCVEETQSQPSADEINFKPIIQNLQFCTNLKPPWVCRLGHEGYFGLRNNHVYLLQQIVNDSISSQTLSVFTELFARDLTGEYGRLPVYDNVSQVTRLMQSVSHMTNLREFVISYNILEPGIGLTALVDSLPHCTELQRLYMIAIDNMRHDDVIALCGAIEKLPKLRILSLRDNKFTKEELQQLMTAAKKTNMQELWLSKGDGEFKVPEDVATHFTDEFIKWSR